MQWNPTIIMASWLDSDSGSSSQLPKYSVSWWGYYQWISTSHNHEKLLLSYHNYCSYNYLLQYQCSKKKIKTFYYVLLNIIDYILLAHLCIMAKLGCNYEAHEDNLVLIVKVVFHHDKRLKQLQHRFEVRLKMIISCQIERVINHCSNHPFFSLCNFNIGDWRKTVKIPSPPLVRKCDLKFSWG